MTNAPDSSQQPQSQPPAPLHAGSQGPSGADAPASEAPDLLPARMLNEFVYCPRLFYYEWVEALWADNADTVHGSHLHRRVDKGPGALPAPEATADQTAETIHARSVTLSSEQHGLIARIDLVEVENGAVCPVDYKRGAPRQGDGAPELWDTDRVQLAAQAIILRENGYRCDEGIVYYCSTRQRVRLPITEDLVRQTLELARRARALAARRQIPPPLFNSPKCPRCSLVGICLPDETWITARLDLSALPEPPAAVQLTLFPEQTDDTPLPPVRRLVPARDDEKPLYLNTQGLRVGISGGVLQVRDKDQVVEEIRLMDVNQVNIFGNIQITTQAIQSLCQEDIPIAWFSMGGWFYGLTRGHSLKNVFLRRNQFRLADVPWACLKIARALVSGKIQNQRTLLQRNHIEPPRHVLSALKSLAQQARTADSLETLRGIEGMAGHLYFAHFSGMLKTDELWENAGKGSLPFTFHFTHRNRRPPRDPVNALLSLAYSLLAKDLTITAWAVGFDPYIGFYHQPRFGRAALALDLMEPFRPIIADSAVLIAINNRMITPDDFIQVGPSVALKPEGRKRFLRAYEQRMDTLATHPRFDYRVSYRRMLEIQTRLLARYINGEIPQYTAFVTR